MSLVVMVDCTSTSHFIHFTLASTFLKTSVEQAKTALVMSRILSQATTCKTKRDISDDILERHTVDFKNCLRVTHLPFCSTHLAYHKPYLRVRAILLYSTDTCPVASLAFLQSWLQRESVSQLAMSAISLVTLG